jgi:protein O-mannosyl-transferase
VRRSLPFLVVATVAVSLYGRTIDFDFVRADDTDLIVGNQAFLSDLGNLPRAFTRSYFEVEGELTTRKTYYRPVAVASFMFDAAMGGSNPRPYHATNVVLHGAATCLLLALAISWGARQWTALAAALVFAVHPVNVQAVAWIAGRNDLLLAVFGLLSLLAFAALKGCATSSRSRQPSASVAQPFRAAVHVLAFGLALFSKETGIFFPVLAVLHQRVVVRQGLTRLQWLALSGDAAAFAAWMMLRARALAGMPSDISGETLRIAATNLPQLLVHAGKVLAPVRLNVSPGVDVAGIVLGTIAVLVFAWIAWRAPCGIAALTAAWALAFLLPTVIVPGMPAYEHRTYLPLLGVFLAVAASAERPFMGRRVVGLVAILVAFAALTYQRQNVFRDPITYWSDGTRDAQFGPIAHVNLGQLHEAEGRPAYARREYLRALERDPDTPKAHNNLGVVLMALDEPELAAAHFKEETARHPWNADAWFNLALWNELHGNPCEAPRLYERAIAENPSYAPAYEKLGRPGPTARTGRAP